MPPAKHMPNILRGPGDYEVTPIIHNDTYPAIAPQNVDLNGVAVFVTGGSRGLGRAMATSFTKAGASYIAVGARSDVSSLATEIAHAARSAKRPEPLFVGLKMDITDPHSVAAAAAEVERLFGKLHVLINNAGILGKYGLIADSNPTEWTEVLDVNLKGPYLVTRAFLPLLVRSTGHQKYIINVTSAAAHLANPTLSAYQISKNGLLKLSTLTNAEYKEQGVVCFAIHPGNVVTDLMGGPEKLPDHHKHVFVETPELSADSLVFLVSERRDWLGGRYINCTWDLPELVAKEVEIVEGNKLTNKFIF